jgi:hypothetical protein
MDKHTPGPWMTDADWMTDEPVVRTPDGDVIAACCALLEGEAPANARLIAAAPDLLEACRAMLQAADELMTEFISKKRATNWGVVNSAMVGAGAAIRKATEGNYALTP